MSRRLASVIFAGALLAAAAACGSSSPEAAAPAPTEGGATTPAAAQAFPVTIKHQFGTTTIPAKPTRVVTVGFNEADFALAFGVKPLGVRDFIGEFKEETRPWAQEALGGTQPVNVGDEINFEKVAALQPDLILGLYSFVDKVQFDKLAAIAPTVGPVTADGNIDWKEQTLLTGMALGQDDKAKQLVADVEKKFADAKAANQAFQGKKLGAMFGLDGQVWILEPTDPRAQFFTNLGFAAPAKSGQISGEQLQLLENDVLAVLGSEPAAFAGNRLFQQLSVVTEKRTVWFGTFGTDFSGALGFGSPLSLPYAIDLAVPRLAKAVDGDPATSTD
ncbi:ABC transporter substrate-binding protein [Tenggerimyces flavus]|uniref:ABC transporter substrate-binding protein n=1 Tax=Tenggerimyces flavus TaxID=1708749 RepID=A0ABV7YDX7_9ACTN|nr:ABC transporter substrate-binding protein [Tenggerimyces flavus]MBM7789087.1 iron complex transport system substrate-binding protein [Tenggerimyces flavus]